MGDGTLGPVPLPRPQSSSSSAAAAQASADPVGRLGVHGPLLAPVAESGGVAEQMPCRGNIFIDRVGDSSIVANVITHERVALEGVGSLVFGEGGSSG